MLFALHLSVSHIKQRLFTLINALKVENLVNSKQNTTNACLNKLSCLHSDYVNSLSTHFKASVR